ncbi:hypothetical protein CRUP_013082 [Coryphaenoides rupestris]|nr:hypothetical protein CRUP_013082 [Coryphaenoides rupestris]
MVVTEERGGGGGGGAVDQPVVGPPAAEAAAGLTRVVVVEVEEFPDRREPPGPPLAVLEQDATRRGSGRVGSGRVGHVDDVGGTVHSHSHHHHQHHQHHQHQHDQYHHDDDGDEELYRRRILASRDPCPVASTSTSTTTTTMGGNLGCHRSIPRDPTDFSRRGKRKFSAACNFGHILVNQERLNINTATEEELMTLPGVNRAVAQNIVEYRECIGGFRKVEDLALVSGVGATKLEAMKVEICVSSRTSSSQHSPSSLRRDHPEHPSSSSCTGMNINTATPAQLMSIRGITEKIARNIVAYRTQRGPFRSIEDLVRVESINCSLLDKIRFQVFVARSRTPSTHTNGGLTYTTRSHPSPTSFSLRSDDLDLPPGGPAHMASVRPPAADPPPQPPPPPSGTRDAGKAVVRIATWDLQSCSSDKANNPGVKEVVCMTLLENDIKLLAVQDLLDREALDKFCVELNQGSLTSVRKWKGPRGLWKCVVSEKPTGQSSKGRSYSGFLWESSSGIDLKDAAVLDTSVGNGNHPHLLPYLAHFLLALVNVHTPAVTRSVQAGEANGLSHHHHHHHHPDDSRSWCLSAGLQETLRGEKDVVVLGDFGTAPQSAELDGLRKEKLSALLAPGHFTDISTSSPLGSHCLHNIWVSRSLKKIYSGHCVVVREGLTNPWIPDNWSWGGVASGHCPVVAEFFVDMAPKELLGRSRVAAVDRGDVAPKHER